MSVDIFGPTSAVTEHFVFEQSTPSDIWTIVHNMGFYPNVVVIDSAGTQIEGDPEYVSANEVVLTFQGAFAGTAYLS